MRTTLFLSSYLIASAIRPELPINAIGLASITFLFIIFDIADFGKQKLK